MNWPEAKPTLGTVRMGRSGRTLRLLGPDALSTTAAAPPPTSCGFTGLDGTAAAPAHQRAGPDGHAGTRGAPRFATAPDSAP